MGELLFAASTVPTPLAGGEELAKSAEHEHEALKETVMSITRRVSCSPCFVPL